MNVFGKIRSNKRKTSTTAIVLSTILLLWFATADLNIANAIGPLERDEYDSGDGVDAELGLVASPSDEIPTDVESSAICIAASNAPDAVKAKASFVCTGTNDDIIINAVIQSLPVTGGEIKLTNGLYNLSDSILIDRPVKIVGEGAGIAAIPPYTTTNGYTYEIDTYKRTLGITTLRVVADVIGIKVQAPAKISGVEMRDFLLEGYGKDRHTKAGIEFVTETDLTFMQNVSVTECYVGLYTWPSGRFDAPNIVNCSFQWCGCGLVMYAVYGRVQNCCIADNNGIASYNGASINCGGLVASGGSLNLIDNHIIRASRHALPGNPGCSLYLKDLSNSVVNGNIIYGAQGNTVETNNAVYILFSNNIVTNAGLADADDCRNCILLSANSKMWIITGNKIGTQFGDSVKTNPIDYAIKVDGSDVDHVINSNMFYRTTGDVNNNDPNTEISGNLFINDSRRKE